MVTAAPAGSGITAMASVEMTMIIRPTIQPTMMIYDSQSHEWRGGGGRKRSPVQQSYQSME